MIMGFGIALAETETYAGVTLQASVAILGAFMALFGTFGLFGCKRSPDDIREVQLSLLILFIDFWAVVVSLAAGIVSQVL